MVYLCLAYGCPVCPQMVRYRAELVKLRFFAGLTIAQAAQVLGISPSTADNDWAYARSWLRVQIEAGARDDAGT